MADNSFLRRAKKEDWRVLTFIIRYLHAWKRYGIAVRELSHMSDYELADIGISRSDIPRVAWEHAQD
jgi:uncharacterized protein YjiS (DUF1127 family)